MKKFVIVNDPQTLRKECASYWSQNIAKCTCGHLESEASRGAILCTLDLLSIPNYVNKKGRWPSIWEDLRTKGEHDVAHNLRKKRNASREDLIGIHNRFQTNPNFANPKSTLFELKKGASRWMSLRKKMSDII